MTMTDAAAPRGLKGVIVADTALGDVRGARRLLPLPPVLGARARRGPDVRRRLVPPVRRGACRRWRRATGSQRRSPTARAVPTDLVALLPALASGATPPLGALRTALSQLAAMENMPPTYDADPATIRANAVRLGAVTPVLVAALYRASHGARADRAAPSTSRHAANYLCMIDGEMPDPARARALEQYLILGIDHGFNASTFTARVVTSTGADVGAAVVAALGALSGPLHGGAPSRALDTLDAIGTPERTEAWVRRAVADGERIMGFGHAVYRTADPRSVMLREVAKSFGGPRVDFAVQVEETVERVLAELKPGRELHTNVEYYAGVVMELCGMPAAAVHADVRGEPHRRVVRADPRAVCGRPRSSGRARATSGPTRPRRCRSPPERRSAGELAHVALVHGGVEAHEADGVNPVDGGAHGLDRDPRRLRNGVPVRAGADRRERDRLGTDLVGDLEAAAVAALEEAGLAGVAALPDRPDGVDHEAGREVEAAGGLGVAEGATAELTARLEQAGSRRPVDGTVDPAPAQKGRVRGIHDGMDVFGDDVAEHDLQLGAHQTQRRFPDQGAAGSERTDAGLGPGARELPTRRRNPLRSGPRPSIVTPL